MPESKEKAQATGASSTCTGHNLVVISGPSGAGKTTVSRALPGRLDLLLSISATTRPPRRGEADGVDYFFLTKEEFKKRVAENRFVEWAEVFGHCYGTPIEGLERARKSGRMLLLEIDVQGGIQIKKKFPEALAILLLPPDDRALRERLSHRGTESAQDAEHRFAKAQEEVRMARQSRCYDVEVVNDQLADTVNEVVVIIQTRRKQA
jgi:guanylate kinase